jgi:hypothetical protein
MAHIIAAVPFLFFCSLFSFGEWDILGTVKTIPTECQLYSRDIVDPTLAPALEIDGYSYSARQRK